MTKGERVGMAKKYLLVASTEACSGKSATILGIADRLQEKGIKIAYTQPVVTGNTTVGVGGHQLPLGQKISNLPMRQQLPVILN